MLRQLRLLHRLSCQAQKAAVIMVLREGQQRDNLSMSYARGPRADYALIRLQSPESQREEPGD